MSRYDEPVEAEYATEDRRPGIGDGLKEALSAIEQVHKTGARLQTRIEGVLRPGKDPPIPGPDESQKEPHISQYRGMVRQLIGKINALDVGLHSLIERVDL